MNLTDQEVKKTIQDITILGGIVNLILAILKIVGGLLFSSIGLLADGIHSLSDLFTDALVLVGAWIGSKPPDENHPYGHAKFETFAAAGIALVLVAVGSSIGWESAKSLFYQQKSFPSSSIIVLALISIFSKEFLFQLTKKAALKTSSPVLKANAWHHRSDAISSIAVLLGGIASLLGWGYGDHVAGLVVGLFIIKVGFDITFENLHQLADRAVDKPLQDKISSIIEAEKGVRDWHRLRTRTAGREIFMDVHILVDPETSVLKGHLIAVQLEEHLHQSIQNPMNIIIHIEPDLPEMYPSHHTKQ